MQGRSIATARLSSRCMRISQMSWIPRREFTNAQNVLLAFLHIDTGQDGQTHNKENDQRQNRDAITSSQLKGQAVERGPHPTGAFVADFVDAEVLGFLAFGHQLSEQGSA